MKGFGSLQMLSIVFKWLFLFNNPFSS